MALSVMLLIPAREASVQDSEGTDTYPFQVENGMLEDDIKAECSDGTNSVELTPGEEVDINCTVNTIRISHDSSAATYEFEYGEDLDAECQNSDGSRRVYGIWVVDRSVWDAQLLQNTADIGFQFNCQ